MIYIIIWMAVTIFAMASAWAIQYKAMKKEIKQAECERDAIDELLQVSRTTLSELSFSESCEYEIRDHVDCYAVYVKKCIDDVYRFVLIKSFPKHDDADFAELQAVELLEKLNEK